MAVLAKDPAAEIDFSADYGTYLQSGEVVATSAWEVVPSGELVVVAGSADHTDSVATVKLAGGVAGKVYHLVNTITTNVDRTDRRTIVIRVQQQ